MVRKELYDIAALFDLHLPEDQIHIRPFGNGHINETYLAEPEGGDAGTRRYILQKINVSVFKKPVELMENILSVTGHLRKKIIAAGGDPDRETLNLIPLSRSEKMNTDDIFRYLYRDPAGEYWRMLLCVENAFSLEQVRQPHDFYESGAAFGRFQRMLADYPMDQLHETIPDFHNTRIRYETLCRAVREDRADRARNIPEEIKFALERRDLACYFSENETAKMLPVRVTHNDTKLNNVLMDDKTQKAVCVVDLDTVMPGTAVFDFGDAIRFGANTAAEDEKDLSRVSLDLDLYETYKRGFLDGCGGALTADEIALLPMGAKEMTYENGIRFLTDYLQNDIYYRTAYPEHNLDRARCQFALLADMERKL